MKKIFLFLLLGVCASFLTACGGDDSNDTPLTVTPGLVSLNYKDTKQLSAPDATKWTSEDEFVASVDQKGLVEAKHVGVTKIVASNGSSMGTCNVVVSPLYKLYDTPILEWGATKSDIKAAETHQLSSEDDDALGYLYENGTISTAVIYLFENGALKSANALMNKNYFANHGLYLIERYQPAAYNDDLYAFMDAMSIEKATMLIGLSYMKISKTTFSSAIYMKKPEDSATTRGIGSDIVKEKLSKFGDLLKLLE